MHVVAPGEFGGRERVVQMLGHGLRGLGHTVHVVAVEEPRAVEPFLAPLAKAGVQTHALTMPDRAYGRERRAITNLFRRLRPDVVHTHGYRPDVLHSGVARHLSIPVVTTVHGFAGGDWKNRFYEWLQRRAFRRFDAVVAVSRPLAERLARVGVPRSRIHAVPNAWSEFAKPLEREAARDVLKIPRDGFVVGWVGRLSREKGADVLVGALPRLSGVPLTVSVVGTGAELVALQSRARDLGVDGRIRWHGAVADAARVFTAFDVFVLSSRTEGTPVVLLEAMAAGVPIVASRVGGVPDVVSPAEAAVIRSEDPVALAAEIRRVYDDPGAARDRARAAHARQTREFSVVPWLQRYEAIYRLVRHGVPVRAS